MTATGGQGLLPAVITQIIDIKNAENSTSMEDLDYSFPSQDYSDFPVVCNKESNRQFRRWFIPVFYTIICLLGVAGNLLVIATVFYFKRLKNMTDVYLLNLSFADLLFALSLPFWAGNSMAEWVLGLFVCKAMHSIYKVSFYSSMFFLSLISVDRYFAIARAVSTHGLRSKAVFVSKVSSTLSWVLALICSLPEMLYTNISNNTCSPFSTTNDQLRVGFQASQIVLGFCFPLLFMSFCYTCIIRTLCHARGFERNKAIKVILAVVVVFLVSQVPYNIVLFWTTVVIGSGGTKICSYDNSLLFATDITQYVAFLRCCLNPFVYAFIGTKFRLDVLKLLKDFGCMSQERFYRYTCGRRRSSAGLDTETTTSFAPKFTLPSSKDLAMD
ncbi:C-C chemokine receptor type 7 isoform X1 [Fundulus heteroclitus]|uniref:C-C chemokine receptor type 7 n=2 Tax=Fundulus heteroclitus TaxID=8078 RepID=A0A147B499_FUNHE|nr:C-C chemokine receptor type 7 isoform X1 [Fundulus heteroclitus]